MTYCTLESQLPGVNDNWLESHKIASPIVTKLDSSRVVGRMFAIKTDSFSIYEANDSDS